MYFKMTSKKCKSLYEDSSVGLANTENDLKSNIAIKFDDFTKLTNTLYNDIDTLNSYINLPTDLQDIINEVKKIKDTKSIVAKVKSTTAKYVNDFKTFYKIILPKYKTIRDLLSTIENRNTETVVNSSYDEYYKNVLKPFETIEKNTSKLNAALLGTTKTSIDDLVIFKNNLKNDTKAFQNFFDTYLDYCASEQLNKILELLDQILKIIKGLVANFKLESKLTTNIVQKLSNKIPTFMSNINAFKIELLNNIQNLLDIIKEIEQEVEHKKKTNEIIKKNNELVNADNETDDLSIDWETKYKASKDSGETSKFWDFYAKKVWGVHHNLIKSLGKPFILEVNSAGFGIRNPFIVFLKILLKDPQRANNQAIIDNLSTAYPVIHNAVVAGILTTKDLKGEGILGTNNLIFMPSLYSKPNVQNVKKYLHLQKAMITVYEKYNGAPTFATSKLTNSFGGSNGIFKYYYNIFFNKINNPIKEPFEFTGNSLIDNTLALRETALIDKFMHEASLEGDLNILANMKSTVNSGIIRELGKNINEAIKYLYAIYGANNNQAKEIILKAIKEDKINIDLNAPFKLSVVDMSAIHKVIDKYEINKSNIAATLQTIIGAL